MSQHHRAAKWTSKNQRHRQRIEATLPAPCIECGRLVYPMQSWDVAHLVDLAKGGDVNRVGPAHRTCNRRSGGKAGAAKTNRAKTNSAPSYRETKLPGW